MVNLKAYYYYSSTFINRSKVKVIHFGMFEKGMWNIKSLSPGVKLCPIIICYLFFKTRSKVNAIMGIHLVN